MPLTIKIRERVRRLRRKAHDLKVGVLAKVPTSSLETVMMVGYKAPLVLRLPLANRLHTWAFFEYSKRSVFPGNVPDVRARFNDDAREVEYKGFRVNVHVHPPRYKLPIQEPKKDVIIDA